LEQVLTMAKETLINLDLTAPANLGQAMGRHEGKVIFVPGGLPGERVRVQIVEDHKRWARGELLEVLRASPDRVDPPCPYYGRCGGCHWQHARYEAQLAYKHQVVVDQLQRLGRLEAPTVRPPIGSGRALGAPAVEGVAGPWFYRNHAQFVAAGSGELGFLAARSHDVVPIERCLLLHPLLDEMHAALDPSGRASGRSLDWPELRRLILRAGIHTGERMCIFEAEAGAAPDGGAPVGEAPELEVDLPISCLLRTRDGGDAVLIGSSVYHEVLKGRTYRVSSSSFFQVNTEQAETLLDAVYAYLDPQPADTLLDLYCGVGVLGLSVADRVGQVIGIEEDGVAIADARANAGSASPVRFMEGKAEVLLAECQETVTKVVLDPPRSGCESAVLDALLRLRPQRIVYVSCDPTTLARDAARLAQGGYVLAEAQPVDMFPQTYHVETVALWHSRSDR
jgi:23S rRNA (uracil1939-C5)-methyltransferase